MKPETAEVSHFRESVIRDDSVAVMRLRHTTPRPLASLEHMSPLVPPWALCNNSPHLALIPGPEQSLSG